jgi:urocanate hydratase
MTMDVNLLRSFAATVDSLHAGLTQGAESRFSSAGERRLEGKLFYAGDLDGIGNALVVAGNIAGAATLTASADNDTQKQAIRDGVIDFLVNSLSEALRILKNEIRKGETVAVCAALTPEDLEREMIERGVLPDLLPPGSLDAPRFEAFLDQGARQIRPFPAKKGQSVLMWSVASAPMFWLPKLDSIAMECLGDSRSPKTGVERRWLRLAPRFLGRLAQGSRLLRCRTEVAQRFIKCVREQVESGEIAVPVEIQLSGHGDSRHHRFSPSQAHKAPHGISLVERQPLRF